MSPHFYYTPPDEEVQHGIVQQEPKVVKEISGGTWGHLVDEHKIDVDTLSKDRRCVEKPGMVEGGMPVTLLRVFRLGEVAKKGMRISGWETFDQHPDLILFEGYLTARNEARLERKKQ